MFRKSFGILISVILLAVLFIFRDIGLDKILNLDAFLIVVGGTSIALLVGFPVDRIRDTINNVIQTFSQQRDRESIINDILELSRKHRRGQLKSIENWLNNINDDFLRLGTTLLINNYESRDIKSIMHREVVLRSAEFNFSQNLLKTVARLTPSFGLAGTVISLIRMFNHFGSVDTVATNMAVALTSTLYGVIIANLFMLPLCAKLKERAIQTESNMLISIEGILSVKDNEHPLIIEEKLMGYQEFENQPVPAAGSKVFSQQPEAAS